MSQCVGGRFRWHNRSRPNRIPGFQHRARARIRDGDFSSGLQSQGTSQGDHGGLIEGPTAQIKKGRGRPSRLRRAGLGSSFMTYGFCNDFAPISDNLNSANWPPHRGKTFILNLALTRNALLAIIPFKQGEPLARSFEFYHCHHREALILNSHPVL